MKTKSSGRPITINRRVLLPLSAVLVFLGIALLIGCSSDEMSSPVPPDVGPAAPSSAMYLQPSVGTDPQGAAVAGDEGTNGGGISGTSEAIESKVIDREVGGIIRNDQIKLSFRPYALDEDTEITIIRQPSDPDKIIFELLPHGIEFNRAVTLTVNLADCGLEEGEVGTIYWYDPDTNEWVDLTATWNWPIAQVRLDHFSKYGGGGRGGW